MQRILLSMVLAGTAPWVSAAQVAVRDMVETAAPDGSARVESIELLDDGTVALAVSGAIFRLDASGQETSRWLVPDDLPIAPPFRLALRPDGAVVFRAGEGAAQALHAVDRDGRALAPLLPNAFGISLPVFKADGLLATVYTGAAHEVRDYAFDGSLRATFASSGFIDRIVALPDGGALVVEAHTIEGSTRRTLRRLDAGLGLAWTQDFTGADVPANVVPDLATATDGRLLALFRDHGFASGKTTFVTLDAGGAITGVSSTPSPAPLLPMFLAAHGTAAGFEVFGLRHPDFNGTPPCQYAASVDATGVLAETCTPVPHYQHGLATLAVADGVDALLATAGPDDVRLERHARRAPQASTVQRLRAPSRFNVLAHDMTAASTAAVVENSGEYARRLLRWEGGETPVVDALLPAADASHVPQDVAADDDGGIAFLLGSDAHADVLRIGPNGVQQRWTNASGPHHAQQMVAAADGRHRVVLGGDAVRLVALDRDLHAAWTHDVAAGLGHTGRIAALQDATSLLAYGPGPDGQCRVRRVSAAGQGTGDSAPLGSGPPWGALAIDGGGVFACGTGPALEFAHVDAALAVAPVSMQGCALEPLHMAAVGGERWVVAGTAPGAPYVVRFCAFEGGQFLHSADVGFEPGRFLALDRSAMLPDASRGEFHVVARVSRPDSIAVEHLVFDAGANRATRHRVKTLTHSGVIRGVAGPDHRGRFAYYFTGLAEGAPSRVELSAPGGMPRWSIPLELPAHVTRMALVPGRLAVGATETSPFSQIVFRVADLVPDLIFDAGFE